MCQENNNYDMILKRAKDRTPTYCVRCQMQKVQVFGLFCCDCYAVLAADAKYSEPEEWYQAFVRDRFGAGEYDYSFFNEDAPAQ